MFAGTLIALVPLFAAGVEGQVTDAYRFFGSDDVSIYNLIASIGTLIFFLGLVLTLGNLIQSRSQGAPATPDPWRGDTLEWLTLSPPPVHNFDVLPDVRSSQPMRDVREALSQAGRAEEESPAGETQPVA
jgi:cytochrome c oxidase subunit 1